MELEQFISKALLQILQGIKSAQDELRDNDNYKGVINPKWGSEQDYSNYVSEVGFDIAITASEQSSDGGKGGIKLAVVEVSGGRENSSERSSVNRVSFRLPVAFPVLEVRDVPALGTSPDDPNVENT